MAGHRKQQSPIRLCRLLFLLGSSASFVWASGSGDAAGWRRSDEVDAAEAENTRPLFWELQKERREEASSPVVAAEPAHVIRDCIATITPPPDLLRRQDQGQIQALSNQLEILSQQSRSVSQASQQVSQSSQQLSQSLQQATQRLSQSDQQLATVRASLDAATQASRSLSQQAADASRQVDQARQSADNAIQQAISSVSRSVSDSMMQSMASVSRSFASALAQASQSAASVAGSAASVVQKAQAEATAVRSEASNQVQQAQGAALSVTQTALAVVGGIIGSSLITVALFVLILRYRRNKRRTRLGMRTPNISYPDLKGSSDNAVGGGRIGGYAASDAESTYSTDDNGFRPDVKEPPAVAVRGSVSLGPGGGTNGRGTPGVGYALSYYGPKDTNKTNINPMSGTTAAAATTAAPGRDGGEFQLGNPPKGKFTLFPRSSSKEDLVGSPQSGLSTTMTSSSGGSGGSRGSSTPQMRLQRTSRGFVPTLETWIRAGTVSPFATVKKGASAAAGSK
ncbi:hypothetical protein QBC47DRAFT_403048 [Echria macrotheca]|uniref:Uncharacterized protein n=1 Tax=Echria macrotheca TaxID=438768 RepID=A0AAJ0F8R4_9PEZI|nr:hypothetical protein QBC47DRAFT_403048 [Echria macrotheca]